MAKFLTLEESAERLGVDYKTVYRLVRAGELPAGRVGRIYRVRKEDIDAYFERQQRQVAEEARSLRPAESRKCSACGAEMLSELSVGGGCIRCGRDICQACWSVRKVKHCSEHADAVDAEQEGEPDEDSEEDRKTAGSTPESTTGKKESKTKKIRETPRQAVQRLKSTGAPALTAEDAALREKTFLRAFSQRIEHIEELPQPLTGRRIALRQARVRHELQPKDGKTSVPENAVSRMILRTGGWGKPKDCLTLEARFLSRLELFEQQGYDAAPLGEAELTPLLDELADRAAKKECFHVAVVASPTGWTPEAVKRVSDRHHQRAFHHKYAAVVLVDLHQDKPFFDESDQRLYAFWPLAAPAKHAEEVRRCAEIVRDMLAERNSIKLPDAARACKSHQEFLRDAFRQLAEEGDYAVDELEDIGTVISRRNSVNR